MKRFLSGLVVFTLFFFAATVESKASHLMGGEITWECDGNGDYVFTFKVYRDCSGSNISPNSSGLIQIHNYPSVGSVTQIPQGQWTSAGDTDISPNCSGPGSFSCANGDDESVFEYVRTFTRTLNGVPPAQGWIITYDDFARNANDNLNSGGLTLRAKILPHSGTVADSCVDNSPQFRELATSLICVGIPFAYNHNATDDELDSLVYEWARPLDAISQGQLYVEGSVPSPIGFQSGYSFNSPFPGVAQDVRNVAATLDRNTGEISLTSFTSGKYVSCVKVTAYKCGEAVAEVYRELQSNLATSSVCATNDKPIVTPPFQNNSGQFTIWNDTVRAGDLVNFNIQITDFASITQNGGDSVTLLASGLQFGDNFTSSTSGCINPPCATLTTSLPQTGFLGVSNTFTWQTDCNHTSFTDQCVSGQNTYTFVVTAVDNRCPLPLKNVGTISITVLADSVILSPLINCVDVQPNGDVTLDWNTTPNINNSFSAWMIYTATNENGPYTLLDSVKTYNQTTYTHSGADGQNERRWYYIRSRSGCKGIVQNVARDTVSTIFVDPVTNANDVTVKWNKLTDPNPTGSASQYRVFRAYPTSSPISFFQNVSGESFIDNFANCEDSVRYRVELVNTAEACTSRSNTLLYNVQFPEPNADFTYPPTSCPGVAVNFTNTTSISAGTATYTWDFGDGSAVSNQTSPTHTYAAVGNYDIELIANTPKGCSDTVTKSIDISFPSADAGGDKSICPGGNVIIGGSPTSTATSPTYNWNPSASLDDATLANPTASPASTTTYTVTVTDGNGCTNTDQVTVNVVTNPTADAGSDQSICNGASANLGGAPTGPVGSTYQWNNGTTLDDPTAANPIASPTVTTTYTVTVTTGVNCTATDQVLITVDPSPTADAGADQNICSGAGVTIGNAASGGTPNYTYSWTPTNGLSASNIASPTASPAISTNYTVVVTDANGCTDDDQVVVTVNQVIAEAGTIQQICNGGSVVIGGTSAGAAPLTYSWNNGASLSATNTQNPTASPTVTTVYTLTVTDVNGCFDTDQVTVAVDPLPTANAGVDQSICPGETVRIGAVDNPAYSYQWNNVGSIVGGAGAALTSNPQVNPSVTTTYTVTVTDQGSGCTATDQVVVTVSPGVTADAGADAAICVGNSTTVGGSSTGTAPLTYNWSNAASLSSASAANPTASPITTTTYDLTVTDANGCTDVDDVTVTVVTNPTADAGSDQTICNGQNATLGGSPTGPAGATYQWNNAASLDDATAANPIASPTSTTTYSVTVTAGSGCSAVDQITISVDPVPTADAGADQTSCSGSPVFIGGSPTSTTAGASYAWDNAGTLNDATVANPLATPTITTTYTVTVTHPNSCTATDQVTVTVNPLPTADAGADQFICDGAGVQIGGAPSGPAGSTYAWDNAASLDDATLANPTASPSATTTFTVTVTDGNGCTSTDDVIVTVGSLPAADAGSDITACPNSIVALGGSPTGPAGATYLWAPTAALNDATLANPDFTVDATTTFTVTVTDLSGCSNTDQITVTAFPQIVPDAGADQTICDGGSVGIGGSSTGGTAPLTFAWDNAGTLDNANIENPTASPTVTTTYILTVSDANGCSATDQMTVSVNSLPTADAGPDQSICDGGAASLGGSPTGPAGATYAWDNASSLTDATLANPIATPTANTTYTVTVTNGNGCTDTDQITITVNPNPDVDAGADQTICSGDPVFIGGSPTSTTAGATYAWDNAGSLNDATAANPLANPTATTTYTVTVTHPNACTATDQVTVTVNPLPTADAGADQFICNGAGVQIGGAPTGPAGSTYAWDNAASLDDATLANPTASPTTTTTFTVTVTDGNGCTSTDQVDVNVGSLPTADAGVDQTICETNSTVIGGAPTGPAGSTYAWDNAASLDDATLANPTASPLSTTTFTVTVTDGNGCTGTDQVIVTVNPLPTADAGADQTICNGDPVFIGGAPTSTTAGATYAWDNAGSLNDATAANPLANPTVTTTYTVTVTHPNGCTNTDDVIITVNALPTADAGVDQTICDGFTAVLGGAPGPAGLSYLWDNAASLDDPTLANPTATPNTTTTYTLTLTDANGCTDTDQITITVNPNPDVDAGADQTICSGDPVFIGGTPTSTVAGATYAWDNAGSLNDATAANPLANPTVTTTYTVTVTHPNACTATDQVTVTVNPLPTADAGADQFICDGAGVQIGGAPTGPAGSTYAWDNAASLDDPTLANPIASPTTTTTFTVTVTDGNGCTSTDQVDVNVGSLPTADAGVDQTICETNSIVIGGAPTGPVGSTYAWDNAASLDDATLANPTASPLSTTTFTVTVTDGNGCTGIDQVIVTVDPLPTADAGADQTICNGDPVFIGGAPTSTTTGATYAWDNAGSLNDATAANPLANPTVTTTYTVTITHPNACTATDQVTVTVNSLPTADAGADQSICDGESATLGGSPTGPAGSTYSWDNAASLDDATLANPLATPTATTTYSVTVTDGNGCTAIDDITITVNPLPDADAGADQTTCEGNPVFIGGSPTSTIAGATYAWDNAGSLNDATVANPLANPTVTTTYTVTVTHPNACTATDQVTITVNAAPVTDAGSDQDICIGQNLTLGGSPTGPAGSTYAWNNASTLNDPSSANPTAAPTITTTYTVTVTDGNGCTNTDDIVVTVNPLPTVDAGSDQTICETNSIVIGGAPTGPAGSTYAWDNAASLDDASLANPTASPLTTTTYRVTVTDGNGCSNTDQVTITVDPLPNVDAGADQTSCSGTPVFIGGSPTSSTAGATYAWDNAASLNDATIANPLATPTVTTTYTVTVTHPNSCTATDDITVTVNALPIVDAGVDQDICIGQSATLGGSPTGPAGSTYAWDNAASLNDATLANPVATPTATTTYSVTVTDGNGCTAIDDITITVNPLPDADAGADQIICDLQSVLIGGSPTSTIAGATYAWDNAVSLNDANLANPTASPNVTTTYTVTVTDPNGCTNTDQMVVTVNPLPSADAGSDQTICELQSVTIGGSPTSTSPTANYAWDNAASLNDATVSNPTASPTTTTTYILTVTDGNGCTNTDAVTITVNPLPTVDAGIDQTICAGQSANLGGSPTGPAGSTYAWDNAASLDDATLANPTATPSITTTYTVTVTDGNGCSNTDDITVTVNPLPDADAGADQSICDLSSVVIGGAPTSTVPGASFAWDNAASLDDATLANPTATPSITTTYTVTVTHTNGCTNTDDITISVNPLPVADAGIDRTICDGQSRTIGGTPTGPAGSTYAWDNASTLDDAAIANPVATPTVTTTYSVTVTDGNGCTATDDVTITVNPLPDADAGADQTICNLQSVTIGGSPTSTAANAFYAWSNGASLNDATDPNPIASPNSTTTYTVTVTDQNGCTNTDQITVNVNPLPNVDAGTDQTICDGQSVGIGGSPTSTTTGVTFAWDNAGSLDDETIANPTASPTVTTTYTITVTDGNGCTDTDAITVTVNPLPAANAGLDRTICEGQSTNLGGNPTGPAGSAYIWDNAASLDDATLENPLASPLVTTAYVVTVTDVNGCTNTDVVLITVNPAPIVDAGLDQTICQLDSVQIGGSPSGPAGASYSWTPTAGLSDPSAANPMASPNDTTKYYVTVTDGSSCTAIDSVVVNVNELPQVDFRVDATCFGDFTAFTDLTSLNSSNIQSWEWDLGDNQGIRTIQNPPYQYANPGTYDVKLIVTSDLGCVDSVTKSVTINPLPLADAGADIELCEGDTVNLGGLPTGPAGATFSWSPGTDLSGVDEPNPAAYPLSNTTYYLSVTDQAGCINYDTVEVNVNPLPTITATQDTSVCKGTSLQLNASGAIAYSWQPSADLNDPQIANPVARPNKNTQYIVYGTDANGCIDTDTVNVQIFNIDFDPSDTSVCFGDSVQLSVQLQSSNPSKVTYRWSPAIGLSDRNAASPMASPPVTTRYQLSVVDSVGCTDRDSILVKVVPTANVNFDYEVSPRCEDAVIEISNRSTNTENFVWKLNGIVRSSEYDPQISLDYTSDNRVTLIGSNQLCTDSISKSIPATTFDSIFQFKDANAFTPNGDGINDLFDPGFEGEYIGCVGFRIYDRWGEKVFDSNIGQYGWDGITIRGEKAPNGTYFYIINIAGREIKGSVYLQR